MEIKCKRAYSCKLKRMKINESYMPKRKRRSKSADLRANIKVDIPFKRPFYYNKKPRIIYNFNLA